MLKVIFSLFLFFSFSYGNILQSTLTQTASFDCKKASTKIETSICNNLELSSLDGILATTYKDTSKLFVNEDNLSLIKDQKQWLKTRNSCKEEDNLTLCLNKLYQDRINTLKLYQDNYKHSTSYKYEFKDTNSNSYLNLKSLGKNMYIVSGESYYGINNKYGPNVGIINFISELKSNTLTYDNKDYKLTLTIKDNKLIAHEDGLGNFGMNVSFNGIYEIKTTEAKKSINDFQALLIEFIIVAIIVFIILFIAIKRDRNSKAISKNKNNNTQVAMTEMADSDKEIFSAVELESLNKHKSEKQKEQKNIALEAEQQRLKAQAEQFKLFEIQKLFEQEQKDKSEYIKSISTSNPIKWGKYTLIINKAMSKFTDIYNFEIPHEYKEVGFITMLANTLLFEECRINKLSPNEFLELLVGFGGTEIFHKLIKPVDNTFFEFEAYKQMYLIYLDFRAREYRPIISMTITKKCMESTITEEEIEELNLKYEHYPMFGRNV